MPRPGFICLPHGASFRFPKACLAPPLLGADALQRCWCHPLCLPPAQAQPAASPVVPACFRPVHRQSPGFVDFLGRCLGRDAGLGRGQAQRIEPAYRANIAGCVSAEDRIAPKGGYTGMSMSFYDAAQKKNWHQTWRIGAGTVRLWVHSRAGLNDQAKWCLSKPQTALFIRKGHGDSTGITWTPMVELGSGGSTGRTSSDDGASLVDIFGRTLLSGRRAD